MWYKKIIISDDPYEHICKAIIIQAVNDYRRAMKQVVVNPRNKTALDEVLDIEDFLKSQWFQQLSHLDGQYILKRLQMEMAHEEQSKKLIKRRLEAAYEQASARG